MDVKKIFTVLITVVGCVIVGAFVLNTLLPNVTSTLINASEDMLFKATGMAFDFNKDNNFGDTGNKYGGNVTDIDSVATNGNAVAGFK